MNLADRNLLRLQVLDEICEFVYGKPLKELPVNKFEHLNEVILSLSNVDDFLLKKGYQEIKDRYFPNLEDELNIKVCCASCNYSEVLECFTGKPSGYFCGNCGAKNEV